MKIWTKERTIGSQSRKSRERHNTFLSIECSVGGLMKRRWLKHCHPAHAHTQMLNVKISSVKARNSTENVEPIK